MSQPSRFCHHCGAPLGPASRFCPKCGDPISSAQIALESPIPPHEPTLPSLASPVLPTQLAPAPPELDLQPYPPPPTSRVPKLLILAVVALLVLGLACCLVGVFWIYPKYLEATETPTKISSATAKLSETRTSTATLPPASSLRSVEFQGVSFSYDPSLAKSVAPEIVPAYTDPGAPPWDLTPKFRQFTFKGYLRTPNERTYPRLSVYPTKEYSDLNAEAGKQISSLRDFLDRKPVMVEYNQDIPFLPPRNSAQAIAAGISFLDFKNGSGVRFLTQYCQDVCPIQNAFFFYTFQGLTRNGRYYISLRLPVSNHVLDSEQNRVVDDDFVADYSNYVIDFQDRLDAQPTESFTPNLSLLDAVVFSLLVK